MHLVNTQSTRRIAGLATLLVLGFLGLAGRLAWLQIVEHEELARIVEKKLQRNEPRPARRGAILDLRGTVLATSVPAKTVCADPSLIYDHHELVAKTLAPLLKLPEAGLLKKLLPHVTMSTNGVLRTNQYVVLKRKVPMDDWEQVRREMASLDLGLEGRRLSSSLKQAVKALRTQAVFASEDHLRQYPSRSLAAHVIGFTAGGEAETDHGRVFEDHGVTGIELTLDDMLSGVHGWRKPGEEMAPTHGLDVVLTLDANIQNIVEDELARAFEFLSPQGMCALVVRPYTGEVLALANLPTFDPNEPGRAANGQRNRATADTYEPGSTFKVVAIVTALSDGRLTLNETVFCENGRWFYGGDWLSDYRAFGYLTFEEVVSHSSNIGTAKAALRLGEARLYNTITNFGFGQITGIPLDAQARGRILPPKTWSEISITRIPIGHEISTTPLQMAMAMAAIANGGVLMQPKLVERLQDGTGRIVRQFSPHPLRRVVSESACNEMKRALRSVVSDDGTAMRAQLEHYSVAGKTGTTEKYKHGSYKSGKYYYASFVGFLPIDRPELCILVGVDEPDKAAGHGHTGGVIAAPVFRAIAERTAAYLRVPPDITPETEDDAKGRLSAELAHRRVTSRSPHGLPATSATR